MKDSYARRVKRGADVLDTHCPNWRKVLNLKKFEHNNCYKCILGQLYGEFTDGLGRIGLDRADEAEHHGFDVPFPSNYIKMSTEAEEKYYKTAYKKLSELWIKEIKKR